MPTTARSGPLFAAISAWGLAACFHPTYDNTACGPESSCPAGYHCMEGICKTGGLDAAGPDGSLLDSSGDGTGAAVGCLPRWEDGPVTLTDPQELTGLYTGASDRNPWISADGLRLYFERDASANMIGQIYLAQRASTSVDFTTAAPVANINTAASEKRPALTPDEKTLVFSSDRLTAGTFEIYIVTAASPGQFGTPVDGDMRVAMVNAGTTSKSSKYDPFLTADGRELYLAPLIPTGQGIARATLETSSGNFGTPELVTELNGMAVTADPALSLDGRVMVFSAAAASPNADLYYATRSTATGPFGTPQKIPTVNIDVEDDVDPMLSSDGCELYFASTRDHDQHQLFRATLAN